MNLNFLKFLPIFLLFSAKVESATLLEKSYEYVLNFGKSVAPNFMSILDCMGTKEVWTCTREKAGKILDGWDEEIANERKKWQEEADEEAASSGRSLEEKPSKIGEEVEKSLVSIAELVHHGVARALSTSKKHHESGGIDTITISTGSGDKKKMKKKKPKPPKIHLIHPVMVPLRKMHKEKGRSFPNGRQTWVIGDRIESSSSGAHISTSGMLGSSFGDERSSSDDQSSSLGHDVSNSEMQGRSFGDENSSFTDLNSNLGHEVSDYGMESSILTDQSSNLDEVSNSGMQGSSFDDENSTSADTSSSLGEVSSFGMHSHSDVDMKVRQGRGVMADLWKIGEEALDAVAEHALEAENKDNGIEDKSSFAEQRGKKKKKKKAILKLLILGAVLKAKIGTLLQILSFKLQVKFFIVAVLGLAINLARLWIDLKNKHSQQPQKVIYYEHAQHQHHYDHEEEHDHGWGPWSRSMDPEEEADVQLDVDLHNSPFRAQERLHLPRQVLS